MWSAENYRFEVGNFPDPARKIPDCVISGSGVDCCEGNEQEI